MEKGKQAMPLTDFQKQVARLLAKNRSPKSHLAGGAALHLEPNSKRYSNDLDYFQDSISLVSEAFAADSALLESNGYSLSIQLKQPGYILAQVNKETHTTKIEWSHDSAWRFLPVEHNEICGYRLHPIDLATNKLLALAGRDEPRDFLDVICVIETLLPLGALIWATVGKDPGFTPLSLLGLLKRRGKYRQEDFLRLHLTSQVDIQELKTIWLESIESAEQFIKSRPPDELGCLYYSNKTNSFIEPKNNEEYVLHFGRPGGVVPSV